MLTQFRRKPTLALALLALGLSPVAAAPILVDDVHVLSAGPRVEESKNKAVAALGTPLAQQCSHADQTGGHGCP